MRIVYGGPSPEVEIAETEQRAVRGKPLEVEDELAARLLEQKDVWAKAKAAKPHNDKKED